MCDPLFVKMSVIPNNENNVFPVEKVDMKNFGTRRRFIALFADKSEGLQQLTNEV